MQSTASLQYSGESHAALEQIHYYLDGIEEGQGLARSMSALQLAEVCASKSPGASQPSSTAAPESTNGRLLLRAKGGLTQCMDMIEELKLDDSAHAFVHVYCMMTLLYFVTLDTENCEAVTTDAFSKVLEVLQLSSGTTWTQTYTKAVAATPDGDAPKKRALLRKKSSNLRLGDGGTGASLVAQAEELLRTDDMFRSTDLTPTVSLTDVVLGVLNNAFDSDHTTHYGISNTKSTPGPSHKPANAALLHDRKLLLRDCGGLNTVARIIDEAASEHGSASHLVHALRLLEQASFLERGTQDHLVLHTNLLRVLFRIISSSAMTSSAEPAPARRDSRELTLMALRVLINLTHKNDIACTHVAAAHGTRPLLALFLHASSNEQTDDPSTRDGDKAAFDMCLLALSALVNCVEHNETNRDDVAHYDDAILDTLTAYFVARVASFEHILLRPDAESSATWKPEDVVLSGSMAMLLGCVMRQRATNATRILAALPGQSPHLLLRVLVAFVGLHAQIGALSDEILHSCIEVETELKALMDQHTPTSTPSSLALKSDDIRASMAQFDVPVKKVEPSPDFYSSHLSIDSPIEFTTPKYPSTFRGSNTPPASAFQFSGGFVKAVDASAATRPKVALRKRTSRALGVDTPQATTMEVKRTKGAAFAWADESAPDDDSTTPTFSTKRRAKSPTISNRPSSAPTSSIRSQLATTSAAEESRAAAKGTTQPTFSRKKSTQASRETSEHLAFERHVTSAASTTVTALVGEKPAPTFSKRQLKRPLSSPGQTLPTRTTTPKSAPDAVNTTFGNDASDAVFELDTTQVLTRSSPRPRPSRLDVGDSLSHPPKQSKATSSGAKQFKPSPKNVSNESALPKDGSNSVAPDSVAPTKRSSLRRRPSGSDTSPHDAGDPSSQPVTPTYSKAKSPAAKMTKLSVTTVESTGLVKSALSKKATPKSSSNATLKARKQLDDVFSFDD